MTPANSIKIILLLHAVNLREYYHIFEKWLNEMLVSDLDNNYVRHPHYSECDTADFPIIFLNVKYFPSDWEEDLFKV